MVVWSVFLELIRHSRSNHVIPIHTCGEDSQHDRILEKKHHINSEHLQNLYIYFSRHFKCDLVVIHTGSTYEDNCLCHWLVKALMYAIPFSMTQLCCNALIIASKVCGTLLDLADGTISFHLHVAARYL